MKYVFFTYDGHGLPIAYKLYDEGQDVIVAQVKYLEFMPEEEPEKREKRLKLYDGMIEKHDADTLLQKLLKEKNKEEWFIVGDFNYVYPYTEQLKKAGFRGLLPTKEDYRLEAERQLAKEVVKNYYPIFQDEESYEFKNVKDALEFLKKRRDKIWGVKGFNPDAETFFPMSNDALIAYEELEDVLMAGKEIYEKDGFILEEKIEDLIEFTPELITFDGEIVGASINVELKPFGAGNISIQTGDSASLDFWLTQEEIERIMDFFPVERFFIRKNEMVIWDAGTMYSPSRKAFYFSEFCSNRMGFGSIFNKLSTLGSVSEFFEKIINKQYIFDKTVKPFGCGIRIFNMMSKKGEPKEDLLIIADPADKNTWLWDVYSKEGKFYTVGLDWNIGVLTQAGEDWICLLYTSPSPRD